MIQWNELRITPDSKHLIIDVSVEDLPYYEDITIREIKIDTQDTYIANGPSSEAIYTYTVDPTHSPDYPYPDDKIKHIRLCLGADKLNEEKLDIDLSKNLLFIYVEVEGTPTSDTPCGADNYLSMTTVCDLLPIYNSAMKNIKELEKECSDKSNFVKSILEYKAFSLSVSTGNYPLAIKYYNKFYKNKLNTCSSKPTCNGLY